ncbi:hypothetical protein SAMN03097699_0056 [Flavobacteriaceae bacterium MAR_2010_188]|nr:hypothetical protein SAMN03097699_0056 [Flavobacteriaceae bacterium MAR_2010_188]
MTTLKNKVLLTVTCIFLSCFTYAQELSPKIATLEFENSESALQLVKNYIDALEHGDVAKMTAQLSDNAVIIGLGGTLDTLSVAQHKEYYINSTKNFNHSFSGLIFLPIKVNESDLVKGEWVLNWGTNTVTAKDSGEKIIIPFHVANLVEGGKIVMTRYYYDMLNLLENQGYKITPPTKK